MHFTYLRPFPVWVAGLAALLFTAVPVQAKTNKVPLQPVTLSLKWFHQFQFAGYYAAVEKGYYAEEGLEVTVQEPFNQRVSVEAVLSGEAQYGVFASDLLKARLEGKPVVVLAVIFQHSPIIVLSRNDSAIRTPADLIGKKVMVGFQQLPETKVMLMREGIDLNAVDFVPHSWRVHELVNGEVDASESYITTEPYQMRQHGVEPAIMRPIDYGIDFYGDVLFTTEQEIERHPGRAAAFRRASLRGWDYALSHVDEMIALILNLPGVRERGLTEDQLRHEAKQMVALIQPALIQIGHINPGRWQRIAEMYVELGLAEPGFNLDGFIYAPAPAAKSQPWMNVMAGIALGMLLVGAAATLWNRQLRRSVRNRTGELQTSREYLKSILEANNDAVFVHDATTGQILDVNQRMCEMYGCARERVLGTGVEEFSLGEPPYSDVEALNWFHRTRTSGPQTFPWRARRADNGALFWVEVSSRFAVIGGAERYVVMVRDITRRKRAEEEKRRLQDQLAQAQKMESVGRLAGGVAHDFNNMLGVIIGHSDLALGPAETVPPVHDHLLEIRKAAQRSSDLTRQLLAYARKQTALPRVLDLNTTIEGMLKMLRRLIGEDIELKWNPAPDLWLTKIDPVQIDQILANLCVNARDAIRDVGTITIQTGNLTMSADESAKHEGGAPGDYVWLLVSDNGAGMSREAREHLFEPFFTTKGMGHGTGLGLATVYGIIKQNEGCIEVQSEAGRGTDLRIYLPRHTGPLDEPRPSVPAPAPLARTGRQTIMVVEDEPAILLLCKVFLKKLDCHIVLATSPVEALKQASSTPGDIHLLITDVVMPEMNGWDLALRLTAMYPNMKRLFMSGYTDDVIAHHGVLEEGVHFIQKPFTQAEFIARVNAILNEAPAGAAPADA